MSRSHRHAVSPGTEWWTARPFSTWVRQGSRWTHWFKAKSHRIERQRAKRGLRQ